MSRSDEFLSRWAARKSRAARRGAESSAGSSQPGESTVDCVPAAPATGMRASRDTSSAGPLSDALSYEDTSPETVPVEAPVERTATCEGSTEEHRQPSQTTGSGTGDDELLLTDDQMPPIESLRADSDISVFFNKGVSAALRKAALRHVFSQPSFNIRDGLDDYDDDYTVFEPLGDTITADMKFHAARKERERLALLRQADGQPLADDESSIEAHVNDAEAEQAVDDHRIPADEAQTAAAADGRDGDDRGADGRDADGRDADGRDAHVVETPALTADVVHRVPDEPQSLTDQPVENT